jgi:uncharacterized protein
MESLEASALAALPIFPLPDTVLFPGALLPLHVFEPRYRELTADVLAGKRLMAIARLRAGFEADYEGRPPVHPTCGVGYLVAADQLTDGRYHILLRGVARVRIESELAPAHAYREVRARLLVDHVNRPELLEERRQKLVIMCDRLAAALGDRGHELRELTRKLESPATCADVLAATLVREADARQALLEESDPAERLEALTGHVASMLVELAPPGGGYMN